MSRQVTGANYYRTAYRRGSVLDGQPHPTRTLHCPRINTVA